MSSVVALASPVVIQAWREPQNEKLQHFVAELKLIADACASRGVAFHVVEWRDRDRLLALAPCAITPLTAWDYIEHFDAIFRGVFDDAVLGPHVQNATQILKFNGNKRYLLELEKQGVCIVPSIVVSSDDSAAIFRDGFAHFESEARLVFKPAVGAGAWKQVSMQRAEHTAEHVQRLIADGQAPSGDVIVQPFLPTVSSMGEVSLLFFDGRLSHAVLKKPKAGDYRVQHAFGGSIALHAPSAAELASAQQVMEVVTRLCGGRTPAYARVDFMFSESGAPLLGEIELFEPYLYLREGNAGEEAVEAATQRLVDALLKRSLV
jgi:hypothetical protein